jgi:translation initiation factor 2 gamma subunit (eIF-2gamma)
MKIQLILYNLSCINIDGIEINLMRPIVARPGDKVLISRRIGAGWRD